MDLTPGAQPVHQPLRYMAPAKMEFIKSEVEKWVEMGICEPSKSAWASPPVVVTKKNGKFRLCIDYTKPNKLTVCDAWPIPAPLEMFQFLQGKPIICTFDMQSGYNQAAVDAESRGILAFITPLNRCVCRSEWSTVHLTSRDLFIAGQHQSRESR
jgi:hypothetical protein